MQAPSQALRAEDPAVELLSVDLVVRCERDCAVNAKYAVNTQEPGARRFSAILTDPAPTVRVNGQPVANLSKGGVPADDMAKLRAAYDGNLVSGRFDGKDMRKVAFAAALRAGANTVEIAYRQPFSVRGQGTENVGLGFVFDTATLPVWRRTQGFKVALTLSFVPALAQALKGSGMKGDVVEFGCAAYGGKKEFPEHRSKPPASELPMEYVGDPPTSLWCTFAAPGRVR